MTTDPPNKRQPTGRKKKAATKAPARKTAKVGNAEVAMTPLEANFVKEYPLDLNATAAAERAGYSKKTARQAGSRLLSKVYIQAAIAKELKKREQRTEVAADRVVKEAARLALFDPRKLFDAGGNPLPIHMLDDDTAAAIAGLEVCSIGNSETGVGQILKYKVADKNSALEKLFKHLGLYEADNKQKTDPLTSLLESIATRNTGSFAPVADDPEHGDK